MRDDAHNAHRRDTRRIVVVGPCASGKTTLVDALLRLGYNAYAVAQEHSIVRDLWRKRDPDVVIALDLPLDIVRQRRSATWPEAVYQVQHERLQPAFEAADLFIDTGEHDIDAALQRTLEYLEYTGRNRA
jgi:Ni2+-binding GTPase involved in maturation of urease and hydrogenase